jgi:hypothetical protein
MAQLLRVHVNLLALGPGGEGVALGQGAVLRRHGRSLGLGIWLWQIHFIGDWSCLFPSFGFRSVISILFDLLRHFQSFVSRDFND